MPGGNGISTTPMALAKTDQPLVARGGSANKMQSSQRLARAVTKASSAAAWPLCHGRCCLVFLSVLVFIRAFALHSGNVPGGTIWFVHFFSLGADILTVLSTLPLMICGTCGGVQGQCVKVGCVGPMMTMIVAMNLVDGCSLCVFFFYAAPRPLPSHGRSFMDVFELVHPVWELVLVASCALNFAVCVSCFRIYRELRAAGLYPPNSKGETPRDKISPFEVLCEAEDVALLTECASHRREACCSQRESQATQVDEIVTDDTSRSGLTSGGHSSTLSLESGLRSNSL